MSNSLNPWIVSGAALAYLALLFLVAYIAEGATKRGNWLGRQLQFSPLIYTLSIAVYCTSWTFFGAVGTAAKSGLEFVTIYLGPSVVFFGWLFILRKLARIARSERVTSIADFLSSRFGKSQGIAALVTLVALFATTPYIALQLKAVGQSVSMLTRGIAASPDSVGVGVGVGVGNGSDGGGVAAIGASFISQIDLALLVALVIAGFTLLFGTRHLNANERHTGIIAAIAFESLVKLFAFVAVGVFVVWGLNGSPGALLDNMQARPELAKVYSLAPSQYSRWMTLLIISAIAVICLPRQFQVTVIENEHGDHLRAAAWMFPLYLFVLCIFVVPIAWTGLAMLPAGSDPDMFVLSLPLSEGNAHLALLAFIGGFSSATSMMIIASIVLALMICNHLVVPILVRSGFLDARRSNADFARAILNIRRVSILVVLLLGYAYLRVSDHTAALASIGLISFAGAAQFFPAILLGAFWRNATRQGAFWAILVGTCLWIYTLLLPAIERSGVPLGLVGEHLGLLNPEGLLGLSGWDPLTHSLLFSLGTNALVLVLVSSFSTQQDEEREQAKRFVDVFSSSSMRNELRTVRSASIEQLREVSLRFLGQRRTKAIFARFRISGEKTATLTKALSAAQTERLLASVEDALAASMGAASSRIIVNRLAKAEAITPDEAIQILDETQQLAEYSAQLEAQRRELEDTARELAAANKQLTEIGESKDEFLRQVSHELRTPLTSVRSFVEIMETNDNLPPERRTRFLSIIRAETERLTRLLEGVLVQRRGQFHFEPGTMRASNPDKIVDLCVRLTEAAAIEHKVAVVRQPAAHTASVFCNPDSIQQAVLNLLTNAIKFADEYTPKVTISTGLNGKQWELTIRDNGPGFQNGDGMAANDVPRRGRWLGAGVGLRVTQDIIQVHNGSIDNWNDDGACVRVCLPLTKATPAEEDEVTGHEYRI